MIEMAEEKKCCGITFTTEKELQDHIQNDHETCDCG